MHEELLDVLGKEVDLTAQDRGSLRAHVTVQNKVNEEEAKRTLEKLINEFEDRAGTGEALSLWRYEVGGEWTHLRDFEFWGA